MHEVTRDCIVSLAAFAAIFGIAYVFLMTRHRERMDMLERNVLTNPFHRPQYGLATLKYGMLLAGIGVGFIMGWVLYTYCEMDQALGVISMVCLFGGLSLIINYLIVRNKYNNKD
ncbi:DUF6249 domain-containing protein [Mucilaginibacter panaciglaebae]|uniref:DUF6249 domain-containing protein n=1 Tax=Mucilaginibacter panaciglaebae TaxID=502331 RepID=A0ABP7WQV3_9SPHI